MFSTIKRKVSQSEIDITNKRSDIFSICFENFPIAVTLTNLDGNILFVNTAFGRLLGYDKSSAKDVNAADLYVVPSDRNILLDAIKKDGKIIDFVTSLKHKDGRVINVKLNTILLSDGKKDFLLMTAENTSRVKNLKKQLAETNKKFRFLYENSSDAIMRLSPPDWKFTAANKATLALFHVKDEKTFASLGPWELSPEYQPDGTLSSIKMKEMIQKAVEEGSSFFEWTHKRYNGENFFATVLLTRLERHEEIFLQAIVRDISQQKKEKELFQTFIKTTSEKVGTIIPLSGKKVLDNKISKECNTLGSFLTTIDTVIDVLKERTVELQKAERSMVSLIEDISEEKNRADEAKKQTEAIIMSSGDGVFVINNEGFVTLFNPAAEKMSGWRSSEVVGKKCCDTAQFFSSETEKEPNLIIKEALSSGEIKKIGPKAVLKRKNGEFLPIADCISPIKDAAGKVTGAVVVFSDASHEREILQKANSYRLPHISFVPRYQQPHGLPRCC